MFLWLVSGKNHKNRNLLAENDVINTKIQHFEFFVAEKGQEY
jgi:hypothetical protein